MNKANFRDLFKSLGIILIFLVIIGLVWINIYPEEFKQLFFLQEKVKEGNQNMGSIDPECFKCVIRPRLGAVFGRDNINQRIIEKRIQDPNDVLPQSGESFNLYQEQNDSTYVFCSWNGSYHTSTPGWLDKCGDYIYTDGSCCNQSTTNFYQANYITDNKTGEKYYGIVFNYVANTGSQEISEGHRYIPVDDETLFINGDFKYSSTITSGTLSKSGLTINEDPSGIIDGLIDCNGAKIVIPTRQPTLNNCNLAEVTGLPMQEIIQMAKGQQLCWNIATNYSEASMNQYCDISIIGLADCSSVYLPKTGMTTAINSLLSGAGSNTNNTGVITGYNSRDTLDNSITQTITDQITTQLQTATENIVKEFGDKISAITSSSNSTRSGLEFPNIGKPTYLNIGSCNNNAPYVYNSGCQDGKNGNNGIGGYLNQYRCYPSMTGEFQDCGPRGYDPRSSF
jgi:predicted ester cyclase